MGDGDSDGQTTKSSIRWEYTNDVLAGALVAFAIGTTAAFLHQGRTIPLWLASVDALSIATAVAWAFGRGAFGAAKDVILGNQKR